MTLLRHAIVPGVAVTGLAICRRHGVVLPSHVALPIHAATNDHGLGIRIWEGEPVEAVREVVEGAVGPWANNEYHEMHVDGLTPQLAK